MITLEQAINLWKNKEYFYYVDINSLYIDKYQALILTKWEYNDNIGIGPSITQIFNLNKNNIFFIELEAQKELVSLLKDKLKKTEENIKKNIK